MKIKRFINGINLGLFLSTIFVFFFLLLKFNNYELSRDETYHLFLYESKLDFTSIFDLITQRIPFTLSAKLINYLSLDFFEPLTVLRITSATFGFLIFGLFITYKIPIDKPIKAILKLYLYFPFLALIILSLYGQRDTMLSLLTLGLFSIDNSFQKNFFLSLITLLRPHMGLSYLLSLIYLKLPLKNKNIFKMLLPIFLGSFLAFLITKYLLLFYNYSEVEFSINQFSLAFLNIFNIGFLLVPYAEGAQNSISASKEILFLARFISPAIVIIPILVIKKILTEINVNKSNHKKLEICFTAYLFYTSFSSMFGYQSSRQQLPYLLALSFLYTKNKFTKIGY